MQVAGAAPRREHQRLPAIPAGQLRLWPLPALRPTRLRRALGSDTALSGRWRSCRFAEAAGLEGIADAHAASQHPGSAGRPLTPVSKSRGYRGGTVRSKSVGNDVRSAWHDQFPGASDPARTAEIGQCSEALDGLEQCASDSIGGLGIVARDVRAEMSQMLDGSRRSGDGHIRGALRSAYDPGLNFIQLPAFRLDKGGNRFGGKNTTSNDVRGPVADWFEATGTR